MTDTEYDIIDELYFVTPYPALKEATGLDDGSLQIHLQRLVGEGLVKVYQSMDMELDIQQLNLEKDYQQYAYLASKKGLFQHNQR